MSLFKLLPLAIVPFLAVSCSSVSTQVANLKSLDLKKKLGMKETPPVVEVKKEKLKKTATAEEKLVAWNKLKQQNGGNVKGETFMPEDFDPTQLPAGLEMPTFGLLPPLHSGGGSGLKTGESVTGLEGLAVPEMPEEEKEETAEETGGFLRTS